MDLEHRLTHPTPPRGRWVARLLCAALALAGSPARALPPSLDEDDLAFAREEFDLDVDDARERLLTEGLGRQRVFEPGRALSVGLSGTLTETQGGAPAFGAMLTLGLPLDRIASPAGRGHGLAEGPAAAPTTHDTPILERLARKPVPPKADTRPRKDVGPAPEARLPSPDAGAKLVAPPAPAVELRIPIVVTPAVARDAVAAALAHAHLTDPDARIDAVVARAHRAAALPTLRLGAQRAVTDGDTLSPTEYDPAHMTATGGITTTLSARATWRLDRLVFAADEVALERVREQRSEAQLALVRKVLNLLFMWQRALALQNDEAASPEEHLSASLKVIESEAELGVLTDAWFTKWRATQ